MVMLGLHFMNDVPFREVVITPLVFDAARTQDVEVAR